MQLALSDRAAFWRSHVDGYLGQRGSQSAYCRAHGLTPRELRKWRTRFYGPVRARAPQAAEPGLHAQAAGVSEFACAHEDRSSGAGAVVGTPVIRRRWTDDEKRRLLWEGLNSGQSLSLFAKRRRIHPSVMHRWLCHLTRPVLTASPDAPSGFADVHVVETSAPASFMSRAPSDHTHPFPAIPVAGAIEIELRGGRRVRVGSDVDAVALRRVIAALEGSSC